MTVESWVGLVLSVAALAYLVVTLIHPTKF